MLKLRFSKPFHRSYMDGRISVCKYDCTIVNTETKEIVNTFRAVGFAKCAPEDVVDADFGRKLADSRAKRNAYKEAANLLCPECALELSIKVEQAIGMLTFLNDMQWLKQKEVAHIKNLCKESA